MNESQMSASLYERIAEIDMSEVDRAMARARLQRAEFISYCIGSLFRGLSRGLGALLKPLHWVAPHTAAR